MLFGSAPTPRSFLKSSSSQKRTARDCHTRSKGVKCFLNDGRVGRLLLLCCCRTLRGGIVLIGHATRRSAQHVRRASSSWRARRAADRAQRLQPSWGWGRCVGRDNWRADIRRSCRFYGIVFIQAMEGYQFKTFKKRNVSSSNELKSDHTLRTKQAECFNGVHTTSYCTKMGMARRVCSYTVTNKIQKHQLCNNSNWEASVPLWRHVLYGPCINGLRRIPWESGWWGEGGWYAVTMEGSHAAFPTLTCNTAAVRENRTTRPGRNTIGHGKLKL